MTKIPKSRYPLSVGQRLGVIMIVTSVPILLVGLITWTTVAIFAGVAVALFGLCTEHTALLLMVFMEMPDQMQNLITDFWRKSVGYPTLYLL